ncbi:hypothetical protein VP01_1193g12 [Puccinia sorghi]|uniref:Uncharacterized protein n=1 Tax=Puccinia sorghi TaxID=27349 RepID=A0A0L6VQT7_9BASI|nr:hypothetical protein VP01_1193g12 [Puccinia sorghi]
MKITNAWIWINPKNGFAHSFRVGGVRAAMGLPHNKIRSLGRWSSDSY